MNLDPIRLEVVKNALIAITEEMSATLQRTAYSTNIKTRADYSCALFDRSLRLVAQAFAQPTHLGSLVHLVPNAVRQFGEDRLQPGDGIVVNDPYSGAVHLNDITIISPIFHDGEIFAYVANIAHHVDVGGGAPGSMGIGSDIYQEGIVLPPTKLISHGEISKELLRLILANVRAPRENAGDFRAQAAANNVGIRHLQELISRYGAIQLDRYMAELLNYTEKRARSCLRALPVGEHSFVDFMDGDGFSDEPVRVAVTVRIADEQMTFDLSECEKQRRGPANATYSMSFSAAAYALKSLLDADIPINDGLYRCLSVIAKPGTIAYAVHPAPVAGGWEVCFRIAEVAFRALADALPRKVVASTKGIICNVAFGGVDPGTGELYAFYEAIAGGYGGRPNKDGMDAVQTHIHNTENSPVEEMELHYPVHVERYELIPDSEGAGRYRGGLGVRRDYRFSSAGSFSVLSDRTRSAPWGLFGGGPARRAHFLQLSDGNSIELDSKTTVSWDENGALFSVQTPGGGGYGPALERDPQKVLDDVLEGKISAERARSVYGVAVDIDSGSIDEVATLTLRAKTGKH